MSSIEITIERLLDGSYPVVVETIGVETDLPSRHEGRLSISPETEQALRKATIAPRDYGKLLGETLFQANVRDAFVESLASSRNSGTPLRVWLVLEDPQLQSIRWERLCAPFDGDWDHLALRQEAPFSLYLPSLTDKRFPSIGPRDLNALIVVSSPTKEDNLRFEPFDVPSTVNAVRGAFAPNIPIDVLASVEGSVGPPTLDALAAQLTASRYTLLHIVCHGALDGAEPVLFLTGSDSKWEGVTATRLIERLSKLSLPPYFAFLSACESASVATEQALGGLAQRLVRELGMPAVVAMTDRVTIATAGALSQAFYRQLQIHGEPDRALVEATAGLAERPDALVPALYSRLGSRPLFDESNTRPLTAVEIDGGLVQMEKELATRAPILLSPSRKLAENERGFMKSAETLRTAASPDHLSTEAKEEWNDALAEIDTMCRDAVDISFAALAHGHQPPPYDRRVPFLGLSSFHFDDRAFFFGRDAWIEKLTAKLSTNPFLPVLGPSGCGKSSLVFAGLLPKVKEAEPDLPWVSFRPGTAPLTALDEALTKLPGDGGLIVADQFEEVFTLTRVGDERREFIDRLLALLPGRRVILTMRADFWGDCAAFPQLSELIQANQVLLPPMSAEELRHAMEKQTTAVNLRFEADLAATMIDEISGEPGAMPLLQHALLELWNRRHGRWIKVSEYRDFGGVKKAISATADAVYRSLDDTDKQRVRDIFVRLTRVDEDAVGAAGSRNTRRRVALADLVPEGEDVAPTKALIARLADARLLVVTGETNRP